MRPISLSRRSALEALANSQSRLRLDLQVLGIDVQKTPAGQLVPSQPHPLTTNSPSHVNVGDYFTFAVTNQSDRPVYYVLLILNNDGTIAVVSNSPTGDRLLQNTRVVLPTPIQAATPPGIDTYKVIATTLPDIDFTVLETPETARKGVASPLQAFLADIASTRSKNGVVPSGLRLDEWGTTQLDLDVQLQPSKARP